MELGQQAGTHRWNDSEPLRRASVGRPWHQLGSRGWGCHLLMPHFLPWLAGADPDRTFPQGCPVPYPVALAQISSQRSSSDPRETPMCPFHTQHHPLPPIAPWIIFFKAFSFFLHFLLCLDLLACLAFVRVAVTSWPCSQMPGLRSQLHYPPREFRHLSGTSVSSSDPAVSLLPGCTLSALTLHSLHPTQWPQAAEGGWRKRAYLALDSL